jgi:hypothetical protein
MATISSEQDRSAAVAIATEYLEDVRTALVAEIKSDSEMLCVDHQEVLDDKTYGPEDRAAAVRHLHQDMGLLDQVLDADGETALTGDRSAVGHVLERVARVLIARLVEQAEYGPMPMRAVLDLTDRVQWAAREAIRVAPSEFDHPPEA